MDRGAWLATVHKVAKTQIQLKRLSTLNTYVFGGYFVFLHFILYWRIAD